MQQENPVERLLRTMRFDGETGDLATLHEEVTLRVWRWDGCVAARGRQRVLDWLREEWSGWPDARLEVFAPPGRDATAGVQFRIQATEDGRYVEHNRALFVACKDGLIAGIDLYCGEPVFSAHREGYIAPDTLGDDQVKALLEEGWHGVDVREWMPLGYLRHDSRRVTISGSGAPEPGSNFVGGARWTAEEADARIEAILADHRRRGAGFAWWVMPFDTPADLPQRLERHGLMLAGQNERMARLGLHDLSAIPVNSDLIVRNLDGSDEAAIEHLVEIIAISFHETPEQIEHERRVWYERVKDPEASKTRLYCVAYLDGVPVGTAAANFRTGHTYLAGAATLPEYRGRRVYSTLLRHRLQAARERGYNLAAIDAGPMSKRIVERYGFREYGTVYVYGWMPEMDPEVIKSLVPDE